MMNVGFTMDPTAGSCSSFNFESSKIIICSEELLPRTRIPRSLTRILKENHPVNQQPAMPKAQCNTGSSMINWPSKASMQTDQLSINLKTKAKILTQSRLASSLISSEPVSLFNLLQFIKILWWMRHVRVPAAHCVAWEIKLERDGWATFKALMTIIINF